MKHNNINFKLCHHNTWRKANPKRDFYQNGNPISEEFLVPVRACDCPSEEGEDGNFYYETENAPCIPLESHSQPNMAFGLANRRVRSNGELRYTRPIYLILDSFVYLGSIPISADDYWKENPHKTRPIMLTPKI